MYTISFVYFDAGSSAYFCNVSRITFHTYNIGMITGESVIFQAH